MMGKFPKEPTIKELRTLIGFRLAGLVVLCVFGAWRAWEGNIAGAGLVVLMVVSFFVVFVLPRAIQLGNMSNKGAVKVGLRGML
jgi:hypothetical protein